MGTALRRTCTPSVIKIAIRFATLACSAFSEQKPALINQAAHDKIEKIVIGVALSARGIIERSLIRNREG